MTEQQVLSRRRLLTGSLSVALAAAGTRLATSANPARDNVPDSLYAFCGTGDHLWVRDREPVDSPATIEAMFQWMAATYGIRRLYWRGGQTMIWDKHYKVGKEAPPQYDWAAWKHHLYNRLKINQAAVAAGKRNGMEMFLYTGLFEFGVQPDIGIVGPYPFEDELRIEHPEWCPVDRWGQRRCPGPISFCYPAARKLVIERYVDNIQRFGYDGVNFYTYVENCGIRYPDEFGFNQPIVDEFNKEYPNVDLRKDKLTLSQKTHWYRCRGKFVTDFLRELHAALSEKGKKVSVILDAREPDYTQPWWGKKIAGTGMIQMDWRTWVDQGIVDELWVQLGPTAKQRQTLDLLLNATAGSGVKLTVRAIDPFDAGWAPYTKAGVTPIAVITSPRNGIERFSLHSTSLDTLKSPDWMLRLQSLADVENGKIKADAVSVAPLAKDPHVLVRRKAMYALAAINATDRVSVLEDGMFDAESSVRMAAAGALGKVNGPNSAARIISALEKDAYFQMKMASAEALSAMEQRALPDVIRGMESPVYAVREVCARSLYDIGKAGFQSQVYAPLRTAMLNRKEDDRVRYFAAEGLVGLRLELEAEEQRQLASDLMVIAAQESSPTVQLRAAWGLGYMYGLLTPELRQRALETLCDGFRKYGDRCDRSDGAFGWRVFGNAILNYHGPGRGKLEEMRIQTDDKWLAWLAYEVVHLPHRWAKIVQVDEQDAVRDHEKYAPPFPGYRKW
jgi:HEAT repeat protein